MCYNSGMTTAPTNDPTFPTSKFRARYGLERTVFKLNDTTFLVEGESNYSRGSMNEKGNQDMADFEGGPFLALGMSLRLATDCPHVPERFSQIKALKFLTWEDRCEALGLPRDTPKTETPWCTVLVTIYNQNGF